MYNFWELYTYIEQNSEGYQKVISGCSWVDRFGKKFFLLCFFMFSKFFIINKPNKKKLAFGIIENIADFNINTVLFSSNLFYPNSSNYGRGLRGGRTHHLLFFHFVLLLIFH